MVNHMFYMLCLHQFRWLLFLSCTFFRFYPVSTLTIKKIITSHVKISEIDIIFGINNADILLQVKKRLFSQMKSEE